MSRPHRKRNDGDSDNGKPTNGKPSSGAGSERVPNPDDPSVAEAQRKAAEELTARARERGDVALPSPLVEALERAIAEALAERQANFDAITGRHSKYPPPLPLGPQAYVDPSIWRWRDHPPAAHGAADAAEETNPTSAFDLVAELDPATRKRQT